MKKLTHEQQLEIARSVDDPCTFARAWLNEDPWEKQDEIMRAVEKYRRVAVRACHSSSKTRTAAALALNWLARWEECLVIVTGPTESTLVNGVFAEIPRMARESRYPYPEPLQLELRMHEKRRIYGHTTSVQNQDQGVKFQAAHAAKVLIIADEAIGIAMPIWDAIEGIMSGGDSRLLALYNPTVASGYVHQAATSARSLWHNIRISAFDTPNLKGLTAADLLAMSPEELEKNPRPYLATREWVKDKLLRWGESSFRYQSRVLGEFPDQGTDALIPVAWAERASREQPIHPSREIRMSAGIDVAGEGEDETVCIVHQRGAIVDMCATGRDDSRGQIAAFLRPYAPYLDVVNVDSIGVGYNFGLHLRDLGYPVQLVNVARNPLPVERDALVMYANLKAQAYWRLRAEFESDAIHNLRDEETRSQLTSLKYGHNTRGQIIIESKTDATLKRGVKSPDRAEALMLAFVPRVVQNQSVGFAAMQPAMISPV